MIVLTLDHQRGRILDRRFNIYHRRPNINSNTMFQIMFTIQFIWSGRNANSMHVVCLVDPPNT